MYLSIHLSIYLSIYQSLPFFSHAQSLTPSFSISICITLSEPAAPYIAALPWNDRNIIEEKKPERRHKKEKIVDPREFQESKASPFMG